MLKRLFQYSATLAACFLYFNATAQIDTSYYDLGRIRIKKDFVQSVTIKGEDLEKFPATNLSGAISVWLSGVYTQTNGVIYVIDGDLINDVNAYSVFDIETVTLIQNAGAVINGAIQQQDLVVIKLRRRLGKSGVDAAGQVNFSNTRKANGFDGSKNITYYQQYYVSAYKNTDIMHYGLSVDYQHDALNNQYAYGKTATFYNQSRLNRFKLYGYFYTNLGVHSVLDASINYVPQTLYNTVVHDYNTGSGTAPTSGYPLSSLLNGRIALKTNLLKHLSNKLSVDYNYTNGKINTDTYERYLEFTQNSNVVNSVKNFLLRDNLQYDIKARDWDIESAMNFSYRSVKQAYTSTLLYRDKYGYYTTYNSLSQNYKTYLLTPSINIVYKNIFNLQGGLLVNLKVFTALHPIGYVGTGGGFSPISTANPYDLSTADSKKTSSFISAFFDVSRLMGADSYSWKFFGSYANFGRYYDASNTLPDFNSTVAYGPQNYNSIVSIPDYYYTSFTNYQAGSLFSLFNKKLNLAYNYEKRQYMAEAVYRLSYGSSFINLYTYPLINSNLHRLSVSANIFNSKSIKWLSTISATKIISRSDFSRYTTEPYPLPYQNDAWSGGWINQLEVRKISFGADLLYQIAEPTMLVGPPKINSFVLQNAYLSYHLTTKRTKNLEVYANTRNLVQNSTADITDGRRFYGLGFKAGF